MFFVAVSTIERIYKYKPTWSIIIDFLFLNFVSSQKISQNNFSVAIDRKKVHHLDGRSGSSTLNLILYTFYVIALNRLKNYLDEGWEFPNESFVYHRNFSPVHPFKTAADRL